MRLFFIHHIFFHLADRSHTILDLIFDAVQNYLADGYGEYASSAISAQGFIRNMLAASFPLYSTQMFTNLGYQWGGTLCALIATVMIPLPVSFRSSFPTISLSSSIFFII